jgi:hypothetical protein
MILYWHVPREAIVATFTQAIVESASDLKAGGALDCGLQGEWGIRGSEGCRCGALARVWERL